MEQNVQLENRVAELVKLLPASQQRCFDIEIIAKAINSKMMAFGPGNTLVWLLESKTLLAYFCGRMCCGDTSYISHCNNKDERVWQRNDRLFPNKSLTMLFGTPNLRLLRDQRTLHALPLKWELIEDFFQNN